MNSITVEPRFTYSSMHVLLIYVLIFLNAFLFTRTQNLIYILHLTYLNSIYILSKAGIMNTGVQISKYKGPLEFYMGTSGNRFRWIEIVHNFQFFGNAGVITLLWL